MGYRTVEITWMPDRAAQWATYTAARVEAARLWGDLVPRHHRLRRLNWRWPSKARFQRWAKGRYPALSAQATQQIIGEFVEAVDATRHLRKNGHAEARYPWKRPRYRDVVGSTNILCIGLYEAMRIGQALATEVVYVRPVKVFRREPDSALGHSGPSAPRREAHAL